MPRNMPAVVLNILSGTFLVDTLPAAGPDMVGTYARVSDLFGEKTDLVLCSSYGSNYFWQPVRPDWARSVSSNQNVTLRPLKSPSLLRLMGTLTATRTITLDPVGAWPGLEYNLAFEGALGLYALTVVGLDLGATMAMLAGGRRRIVYDGSAFQSI